MSCALRSPMLSLLALLLCGTLTSRTASAQLELGQPSSAKDSKANQEPPKVDAKLARKLASPRRTLRTFIEAADQNQLREAADCLDLRDLNPEVRSSKGPLSAFHLKEVIDRMWLVDFSFVSDDPNDTADYRLGDNAPGLTDEDLQDANTIIIGHLPDGTWRFTKETVALIEPLYDKWKSRERIEGTKATEQPFSDWLREQFPESLRKSEHFLLPDYQWLCLAALIFLGFLTDMLVRTLLRRLTAAWFRFVKSDVDFQHQKGLWKPVGLLTQALVWYFGTRWIGLPDAAMAILLVGLKFFAVVSAVWTAFLLINLLAAYLAKKASLTDTKFDDLLISLVSRSLKVFAVCIGLLTGADALDLPLAGLIGGLGLGGMALALASKDTVSNLFGSLTVLLDRPFEVGDWIVAGEVEGTVEAVGFRSTRVRTFYGSLVTMPNSLLTTAVVDNMGRRSYRRIKTMIGVQYDTTPENIDAFCEGIRELIRRHPYTRKDYYHVYLNAFSASSLDILVYCFIQCEDYSIELREKHRLYADIIRLAGQLGISFAFPTRTLHMVREELTESPPAAQSRDPANAGRAAAARIAGPLLPVEKRPGGVEFTSPTRGDWSAEVGDGPPFKPEPGA